LYFFHVCARITKYDGVDLWERERIKKEGAMGTRLEEAMGTRLFDELKAGGLLDEIPNHELEDLLGIGTDDFDERKIRHGYPASGYYKRFSSEQAGKEKILTERLLNTDIDRPFALWRISYPEKRLIAIASFSGLLLASLIALPMAFYLDYPLLAYFGFVSAIGSILSVAFLIIYRFPNPEQYFERSRREEYRGDIPFLPKIRLRQTLTAE
jgi:hypothetical protein